MGATHSGGVFPRGLESLKNVLSAFGRAEPIRPCRHAVLLKDILSISAFSVFNLHVNVSFLCGKKLDVFNSFVAIILELRI